MMQELINKAIKHYKYEQALNLDEASSFFVDEYNFFARKDNLKKHIDTVWLCLTGIPNSTHIKAKNQLFQGNTDCWKYFERTAVFWTYGHINDKWIDHTKGIYEYILYVERQDLLEIMFEKSLIDLTNKSNLANREFIRQKVYPSTQLVHFLVDKWLGNNPVRELIGNYGDGYGIYQKVVDNWDDFSKIEQSYWDELCMYHLNSIGLQRGEKWENEEFLACGLVPMEIINLIKVRGTLGLDLPCIDNALFKTNMAKFPAIPTGYNENIDVLFSLADLTVKTKKKYTIKEVIEFIKAEYGDDVDIIE